jgi:hypothetical protein
MREIEISLSDQGIRMNAYASDSFLNGNGQGVRDQLRSFGERIDVHIRVTEAGNIRVGLFVHPDSLARTVRVVKSLARKLRA